jgi:KDO2-lipid IV(A) lauroyltransferase
MKSTMKTGQFRLEYAAVRLLLGLSRLLGPVAASNFGGWLARLVGPVLPVSRVARSNLARALPELPAAARNRALRGMWDNLGRTVAELPHLPALQWEVVGAEHLAPLVERGGPAILVSGHLANWEVLPPALARMGIRMGSVYRAADNPAVDALVNACRAAAVPGAPLPLFPKGAAGARAALRYLANGGVLGMLADQKLNDGIAVPLLGHPAMTAPAPALMALRFRCPLIPGRVERLGPCRFRLVVEPPLPLPEGGDRHAAVRALTLAINDRLSAWVRDRPAEWLWLHRRWPD